MTPLPDNLPPELQEPWQRLLGMLQGYGSLLVAFSGGVDSSLLLAAAAQALGQRVKAGLCRGPLTPPWEVEAARALAKGLGVELLELDLDELADPQIAANGPERCFFCKRRRLSLLQQEAQRRGLDQVAEGSQIDDAQGHRPGARAVAELGVVSPLALAGLGKAQVRALSRALGLATAEAPSGACLATRLPFGTPLTQEALQRVARAEGALRSLISGQARVRDHYPLARLELGPEGMAMLSDPDLRQQVVQAIQAAGYDQVVLDLQGYRPHAPA